MNTTYRCAARVLAAFTVAICAAAPALAQVRNFPPGTLRGNLTFGDYPQIELNGKSAILSPGTRIRDQSGRAVLPVNVAGTRHIVHYTVGMNQAQVQDVWLLRPEELAIRPWPRTLDEATTWTYDITTHSWTKP